MVIDYYCTKSHRDRLVKGIASMGGSYNASTVSREGVMLVARCDDCQVRVEG